MPFVAVVAAYFAYTRYALRLENLEHVTSEITTPWVYLLTQLKAHATEYATAFVWPFVVRALPDLERASSPLDAGCLAGLALVVGSLALAWRWRRKRRVVAFSIVAYWLTMAVESSVLPLERPIAHYRCYPGSAFLYVAVVALAAERVSGRALLRLGLVPVGFLMVVSLWSNTLWTRPESLWSHSIAGGAEPIAYEYLAAALLDTDPRSPVAAALVEEAYRRNPRSAGVLFKRGYVRIMRGEVDEGLRMCHDTLAASPAFSPGWYGLALAYMQLGRGEEAFGAASRSVELEPRNGRYRAAAAAHAAFLASRNREGIEHYDAAARLGPVSGQLAWSCARALVAERRCAEGLALYAHLAVALPADRSLARERARAEAACAPVAGAQPLPPPPPFRP